MKVVAKIFSVLLSIVLVVMVVLTAVINSLSDFVRPENIREELASMDISKTLGGESLIGEIIGEKVVDLEVIDAVLESEGVKEIVGTYVDGIVAVINGDEVEKTLDYESIKSVLEDNKEEIIGLLDENTNDDAITRAELEEKFDSFVANDLPEVVENIPQPEEVRKYVEKVPSPVMKIVSLFMDGTLTKICMFISIGLAVIIFLLNISGIKGFIWLGIDAIVSGLILGAITLSAGELSMMIYQITHVSLSFSFEKSALALPILLVGGAVFIVLHVVIRIIAKNRMKKTEE